MHSWNLTSILLASIATLATGCGDSIEPLCRDLAEQCSEGAALDAQVDACVEGWETAKEQPCADLNRSYLECAASKKLQCEEGAVVIDGVCDAEENAYLECRNSSAK